MSTESPTQRAPHVDQREPSATDPQLRGLGAVGVGVDRVPQPHRQAGRDVVVRLGEPLVGDVHLAQAAVHRVAAVVERLDRPAVLLGQVHRLGAVRRGAAGHRGRQPTVQVVAGLLDLDPLLLAELRGAWPGTASRRPCRPTAARPRSRSPRCSSARRSRTSPRGSVGSPWCMPPIPSRRPRPSRCSREIRLLQQLPLPAEVGAGVGARIAQDGRDLVQGEAEFAVEQDVLQPLQVVIGVPAIAGPAAILRLQQADLAVVVQRPDRHTCQVGDLPDRVTHAALPGRVSGPVGRTHRECSLTLRQGQPVFRRNLDGSLGDTQPAGPPEG